MDIVECARVLRHDMYSTRLDILGEWGREALAMMTLLDMVSLGRDRGQGMLEYALIILFVMLVVFGGLFLVGPAVKSTLDSVLPAL